MTVPSGLAVVVSLTGGAVAAIGFLGVVAPRRLRDFLARRRLLTGLPVTLALRVAFGALFLVAAPSCRLPGLVRLIGALELGGAVVLLALGSARLDRFVGWWLERAPRFIRVWCSAALALGVLIVYAGA